MVGEVIGEEVLVGVEEEEAGGEGGVDDWTQQPGGTYQWHI